MYGKLAEHIDLCSGRIALLGLAFKPGTDDLRDAPSLKLARRLLDAGATLTAYDPIVTDVALEGIEIADGWESAARDADAVVVVTEWEQFLSMNLKRLAESMRGTLFVDARNAFDPQDLDAAGLTYRGVGRS